MPKEYFIKLNVDRTTILACDIDRIRWYISDDGKLTYSSNHRWSRFGYVEIYKDFLDKFKYLVSALLCDGPYTPDECDGILKSLVEQINIGFEPYGLRISGIEYDDTANTFTDTKTYYEFELDEEYVISDRYIGSDILDWLESHNISYTDFLFDNRYIVICESYDANRTLNRMIESGIIDPTTIENYEEVKGLM